MKPTNLSRYLSNYLLEYLPNTMGLSHNTITSRRDSYMLLFLYLQNERKIKPETAEINLLSKDLITEFLSWLESERSSSAATRNIRLSAIKSFFSYVQVQTPDYMYQCQQIMSIPLKKIPEKGLEYLTLDGVKAILDTIDTFNDKGLRDLTLLSLMYDSAARVQEIADLCIDDFRFDKPYTLRLTGKGCKTRIIPIMEPTAVLAKQYIDKYHNLKRLEKGIPFFYNRSGTKLTRAGISYILNKYVEKARATHPSLIPQTVSPHGFRHSKSMHMLQAGVPLIYIRDYLGHVELTTTEIYAKCDTTQKREAIEAAYPDFRNKEVPVWQSNTNMMDWLKSLC